MRALRFLLSLSFLGFAGTLVQADGARTKSVELPAAQPSVAVTVERGVRVWRPLGTDQSGGAFYPQAASVNSGSEPQVQYVIPNSYGASGVYGGAGGFGYVKRHERRNGAAVGSRHVTVNIKGSPSVGGPMKVGHFGRHHRGAPKHVAFAVKGGGAKHGGGHGRALH